MEAILEDYLQAISAAGERIARAEEAMLGLLRDWRLRPAVEALMAFKGFALVAAMITVSELGDIHRFAHPRQLMAYLGLVSAESSSGSKRRQGGITKTGNPHLRWLLIECAQHLVSPPIMLSWKAQNRLHQRFMRLAARRLQRNKALVAIARELCGFIWALLREQKCYLQEPLPIEPAA
jgi:transposase